MLQKNEDQIIGDQATFDKFEKEIEISVSLNLGLAYLKVKEYQLSVKYCTNVLNKDPDNDKAYYRRGVANMGRGDIKNAKIDLTRAHELTGKNDPSVIGAIKKLKERIERNKEKEKEISKKMITSATIYDDIKTTTTLSPSNAQQYDWNAQVSTDELMAADITSAPTRQNRESKCASFFKNFCKRFTRTEEVAAESIGKKFE